MIVRLYNAVAARIFSPVVTVQITNRSQEYLETMVCSPDFDAYPREKLKLIARNYATRDLIIEAVKDIGHVDRPDILRSAVEFVFRKFGQQITEIPLPN